MGSPGESGLCHKLPAGSPDSHDGLRAGRETLVGLHKRRLCEILLSFSLKPLLNAFDRF